MHSVKWPLTRLSSRLSTEIQNRKSRIAGSSLNKGSVQRWLITSHERVVITQACRQMAGLSATNEECVRKEKGKIKDVSWWTWCQESTVHSWLVQSNPSGVDFVTDRYPDISIKNPERAKHATAGAVKVKMTGAGQKCPKKWKKFLSSGENKRALTRFLL